MASMAAQSAHSAQEELVREVHLKVDPRYALIKVIGEKGQEQRDRQMPRNLHNAAELFLRVGMVACAEKLQATTAECLDIYGANPDGAACSMGQAAVCWDCGYCGLPREGSTSEGGAPPTCGSCGSTDANWLDVTRERGGKVVPWVQKRALTADQKRARDDAARAAKRAEVEANVRAALAARRVAAS